MTRKNKDDASSVILAARQASSRSSREPSEGFLNLQTARLNTIVGMMRVVGTEMRKVKERGSEKEGEVEEGKMREKEERRSREEKKADLAEWTVGQAE